MNRAEEFRITLSKFLKDNTDLTSKEISVVSNFLSAFTITTPKRLGVLGIMLKAIETIEKFMKTGTIEEPELN